MNHFHAAGGHRRSWCTRCSSAGLLHDDVHTVAGPRAVALHHRGPARRRRGCAWEEGPKAQPRHRRAARRRRPVLRRRRPADARRQPRPRGHQDLGGQARAPAGQGAGRGLRRPGRLPRRRSATATLEAATSSRWSASRARPPTACPSCTSSPPRSACCRTAASGSRSSPTAGCPARPGKVPGRDPPHPRGRRSAGRSPGSGTATSSPLDADAGLLELHVAPYDLDARPHAPRARRLDVVSAPAASCSRRFRATVGPADQGASVFPGARAPIRRMPVVQSV